MQPLSLATVHTLAGRLYAVVLLAMGIAGFQQWLQKHFAACYRTERAPNYGQLRQYDDVMIDLNGVFPCMAFQASRPILAMAERL